MSRAHRLSTRGHLPSEACGSASSRDRCASTHAGVDPQWRYGLQPRRVWFGRSGRRRCRQRGWSRSFLKTRAPVGSRPSHPQPRPAAPPRGTSRRMRYQRRSRRIIVRITEFLYMFPKRFHWRRQSMAVFNRFPSTLPTWSLSTGRTQKSLSFRSVRFDPFCDLTIKHGARTGIVTRFQSSSRSAQWGTMA